MKKVSNYLADVWSALIGRTRKQSEYLNVLLDKTLAGITTLSVENQRLKARISELEAKPKALKKIAEKGKAPVSKKKVSPKKGQ